MFEAGIKHHFRSSTLTGANQMYCDRCDKKRDATVGCVMQHCPEVLMLLLKRFMFDYSSWMNVKNNCPVDIPCTLQILKGEQNQDYELYAIVDHVGSLKNGHYSARIKDDKGWCNFNDSWVTLLQPLFEDDNFMTSDTAYLLFYRKRNERRNAQDVVAGEVAEDHSAPSELKEQGTGFLIPGQHDLPGAQTEENAMSERQCSQDTLPTSDLNNDSKVLGKDHIDKQGGEQDCGVIDFNVEDVGQEVIGVESTSQRTSQTKQSPESNTGTLEGQQRVKRPKVLNAKIITDFFCCKRLCTTSIENITIETTEDDKQKIVRCTKKHPNLIAFDQSC
ncbi:uncharacterized protein LOC142889533 isoform X2 [Nelusetta ayraudi]|uniref:uncharacterized protein LOC142889533 isoform X2 n=1 Tax=Nelusetta ayraudi TaxID=303726 RepID=UPI003F6E4EE8